MGVLRRHRVRLSGRRPLGRENSIPSENARQNTAAFRTQRQRAIKRLVCAA